MIEEQQQIKKWFDKTYSKWGFMYLRPQEAYEIFTSIISPERGSKHLDVACGLGLLLKAVAAKTPEVYGIDLSDQAIKMATDYCSEAQLTQGNAEKLPYENGSFDSISCIGSLERMLDRKKVLGEQMRVGRKGAKFCYMVRNSEHLVWRYFWKPFGIKNKKGHQDAMNLEEWTQLFQSCGFEITKVYPDHWPYYKIVRAFTPWKKHDFSRIKRFPLSIRHAYEFIFLLQKV